MICPTCGTENPSRRKKCKFCGSPLVDDDSVISAKSIPDNPVIASVQGTEQVQSSAGLPGVPLAVGEQVIKEYRPSEECIAKTIKINVATTVIIAVLLMAPLFIATWTIDGEIPKILPVALLLFLIYIETPLIISANFTRSFKAVKYYITNMRVIITNARKQSRINEFPVSSVKKVILSQSKYNKEFKTVLFVLERGARASAQNGLSTTPHTISSDQSGVDYKRSSPAYIRVRQVTPRSSNLSRSFLWIGEDDADGIQQLIENLKNGDVSVPNSTYPIT